VTGGETVYEDLVKGIVKGVSKRKKRGEDFRRADDGSARQRAKNFHGNPPSKRGSGVQTDIFTSSRFKDQWRTLLVH